MIETVNAFLKRKINKNFLYTISIMIFIALTNKTLKTETNKYGKLHLFITCLQRGHFFFFNLPPNENKKFLPKKN